MKTNKFYLNAVSNQSDRDFVNTIFREMHANASDDDIDAIFESQAFGPLSAFHLMRLFEKVNHIDYVRLIRIAKDIEVDLHMKGEHQIETILTKAQDIVYNRTEEQSRNYGDIQESIKRASSIASHISGNLISPAIIYISIISIKLSREAHAHKEDNLLDAVAYMSALNDYLEKTK
jgi:hypothetical protein